MSRPGSGALVALVAVSLASLTSSPVVPVAAAEPLAHIAGFTPAAPGTRLGDARASDMVSGQLVVRAGSDRATTATRSARVAAFARGAGMSVTSISPEGTLVNFRAPAAAVGAATHTRLGRYLDPVTGHESRFADDSPTLPGSIASLVLAIDGLSPSPKRHHAAAAQCAPVSSSVPPGLQPADIQGAYAVGAGILAGDDGTGMTIGLLELNTFDPSNVLNYDQAFYGPGHSHALPPTTTIAPMNFGIPDTGCGGQEEAELDIEVIHALAPGAQVKVYEAAQTNTDVNNAYAAMVADSSLSAISTSWGLCEFQQGASETTTLSQVFAGSTLPIFAATGDSGAFDCIDQSTGNPTGQLQVDSPASDPMVTGTGGTRLHQSSGAYSSETAWDGSGGGLSTMLPRQAWQVGSGVANSFSNGMRQVPDVALEADPNAPGYDVYTQGATMGPAGAGWAIFGGTSASAPGWAAAVAIYDQYAAAHSLAALGPANPTLYAAAMCPQGHTPFHDPGGSVNNGHYPTTAGWDYVTGLGSFNLGELAATLAALPTAPLSTSTISAGQGQTSGGNFVTITGCGFKSNATVSFGGTLSVSVTRVSPAVLIARVPAHQAGTVDVTVTNPGPVSSTLFSAYTYLTTTVLAVTAPDGSLWYSVSGNGYAGLGGRLLDAPAVTSVPAGGGSQAPLFVGVGADHDVWVTIPGVGWQPLTDSPVYCLGSPAAAVVNGALIVACTGGDHGLWWSYTSVPPAGTLPRTSHSHWLTMGGSLVAGPAVAAVGNATVPTFFGLGTDHHVWTQSTTDGAWTQYPWSCNGHVAAATSAPNSYFACQGTDGALWAAAFSGGAWHGAFSLAGSIVDGPGIAAGGTGPAFFAEGGDQGVWERSLNTGWGAVGGTVMDGAAATALN